MRTRPLAIRAFHATHVRAEVSSPSNLSVLDPVPCPPHNLRSEPKADSMRLAAMWTGLILQAERPRGRAKPGAACSAPWSGERAHRPTVFPARHSESQGRPPRDY